MTKSTQTETPALAAMLNTFNPHASTVWAEVMNAQTRFIMDRLQKDMEAQKAVLTCRDPSQLLQIQSDFYQSTIAEYAEQTARMLKLTTDVTAKTMEAAKAGYSRAYDDVPL
ncbi:MAG: phasin family protein [Tateyamaria sp.]|jgi:hypothetical protein|uniref:phasin family protein n=1 Tax=Tateyamaria sp. TaxID=1929288 RepID=UPI0032DD9652